MIDFASPTVLSIIFGPSICIWIFSRGKYKPEKVRSYSSRELIAALVLAVFSIAALSVSYLGQVNRGVSFLIAVALFIDIIPVAIAVILTRANLESIRITTSYSFFSLILGLGASVFGLSLKALLSPTAFIQSLPTYELGQILLIVMGAFGDELLFRGFVQTRIEGVFGPRAGITSTAVLSQIEHLPVNLLVLNLSLFDSLLVGLITLPTSMLFSYIAHRSQNLLGSTIYHVVYNLLIAI